MNERWRVGKNVPKNLYKENDQYPHGKDIGRMDTEEDALLVVRAVNHFLELSDREKGSDQVGL